MNQNNFIANAAGKNPIIKSQQFPMDQSINFTNRFVTRNYLININAHPVVPLDEKFKRYNVIRLYKIDKLVFDLPEGINDKLITVYNALSSIQCTAMIMVDSDGTKVDFYIGIRSEENASTAGLILEKALLGNFPGSSITNMRNSRIEEILTEAVESEFQNTDKSIASVSVVPSVRGITGKTTQQNEVLQTAQGIETFIDTMAGSVYTALIISKPISKNLIEERKHGFEQMHTALSAHSKVSLTYGTNESEAVTEGITRSTAATLNESRSRAFGGSEGYGSSSSSGYTGMFGSSSSGESYSSGTNWSNSVTEGSSRSNSEASNKSSSSTTGSSKSLQITHENKSILNMMERIQEQLDRIKSCESFGLWESAGYFISQDVQTAVIAANTYKSLMTGDNSAVENSFVNLWSIKDGKNTNALLEYAKYCVHPSILVSDPYTREQQLVNPTSVVSGNELPIIMGLPKKSVTGITTIKVSEFGRNVFTNTYNDNNQRRIIDLGNVCHMGVEEGTPVHLDVNSLSAHCFVCGSTGAGKSNTSYRLIEELLKNNVNFLVIEPAKGEYRKEFGAMAGINVFTTNPNYFAMLMINPFEFMDGIHVLEHMDRLIEIFNACWPMFGAMPAILKEGLERTYMDCGWDLLNSIHFQNEKNKKFPTFNDLLQILPNIIAKSSYSKETKNEYTGALITRINSLTNGILGQVFCSGHSISDATLFDENTIIDISRVGSSETKSLLMGLIILKLSEYRTATTTDGNSQLKHVTILEEAHNILKRTSTAQSLDSANVAGKAVEMLSASIAEMRTYGEGFIIIDQSPGAVDISAIKNTNTKIIMRLPDEGDCISVGKAASLRDDQIKELSRLGTGTAVVFQNNWLEPVMTKVHCYSSKYSTSDQITAFEAMRELRGLFIEELFEQHAVQNYNLEKFKEHCTTVSINDFKQTEMLGMISAILQELEASKTKTTVLEKAAVSICACLNLFEMYPLVFDYEGALQDEIPKEITNKVLKWYSDIRQVFLKYVRLSDKALINRTMKYLLRYKSNEGRLDSMKYKIILKVLQKSASK